MRTDLYDLDKSFALPAVADIMASIFCFVELIEEHLAIVGGHSLDGDGKDRDDGEALHGCSDLEQVSIGASIIALFMQEIVYLYTCYISLKLHT